jgi:hypothetical protein
MESTPTKSRQKKSTNPMYTNPSVQQFRNSLNPEELVKYQQMGEAIYNTVDYVQSKVLDRSIPGFLIEPFQDIKASLKSGLHPSELDADEKRVMVECLGDDWYVKFGYVKEDLTEFVTYVRR